MGYSRQPAKTATAKRTGPGGSAVHVEGEVKQAALRRLQRIEGQVRGLSRMVEEERYCGDVLVQISSVQEALHGVAAELLRNHLRHCARKALRGTEREADAMVEELVGLVRKHAR